MDITIDFLGNASMNTIIVYFIVNEDDEIPMLNVANELEGLGSREAKKDMQ
jgi:hypothetical protein